MVDGWMTETRRDMNAARAIKGETARNRARRRAAEDRLWNETTAAYAADQASAKTDDLLKPLATRGPNATFTDDELEDF